ncbi:hypothetical protein M3Y98_00095700 [Aphelenchoides besseyi]|nr:hypothetical protein M3Y98_00095700 [Aphelenchoides besseyi]
MTGTQNFNPAVNNQNECKDSTKLDGTSDCPQSFNWCNRDNNWTTFMTQMCPKTCCKCVNSRFNGYYGYYYYGRK